MSVLHPTDFPFTRDEVAEAFLLAGAGEAESAGFIEEISGMAAEAWLMTQAAVDARVAGSTSPREAGAASLDISDSVFALLWHLPACRQRVETLLARRWAEVENAAVRRLNNEAVGDAVRCSDPSSQVASEVAAAKAAWESELSRVRKAVRKANG